MSEEKRKAIEQAITVQERARRSAWTDGDTAGAKALTDKIEQNKQKLR